MSQQSWRSDALMDVQRMINRTLHNTPFYQKNSRRRTFNTIGGSVELNHPFKVTAADGGYKISGGYVFGYDDEVYIADAEMQSVSGGSFFYLEVIPKPMTRDIGVRLICSGKKDYCEYDTYYFPVAEIGEDGEIIQHQFGNLVTPFRRNYIPVIDTSVQCLLKVKDPR